MTEDDESVARFHRALADQALHASGPLPPREHHDLRLGEIARRCQVIAIESGVDLDRFEVVLTPTKNGTHIALAEKGTRTAEEWQRISDSIIGDRIGAVDPTAMPR